MRDTAVIQRPEGIKKSCAKGENALHGHGVVRAAWIGRGYVYYAAIV
jgi:hypothetical protein